jgi:glycerophosphoryl diester phosphodiesterase
LSRIGVGAAPLAIAHRGASGVRPENTRSAYTLAVEQGADMIEIDLHRTRDGAIVVMHDADLGGLGGRGEVGAATLTEVRALDAGQGERVPTLEEVLSEFGRQIPFNLELKRGAAGEYPGLEGAVLEAVERRGLLAQTLFSSFYDGVLERLRNRTATARIGVLVSARAPRRWLERARAVRAEAVHFSANLVDAGAVEAAHAADLAVLAFTVDAPREMRRLLALGVEGLFSNHPDRLRAEIRDFDRAARTSDR